MSKRYAFLLAIALTLAAVFGISQELPKSPAKDLASTTTIKDGIKKIADLAYVPQGHPRQRLDLYLPEKSTGLRPLIAWIHGGGWSSGDKSGVTVAPMILNGFAVASIEYRFSQDAIYPAQIQDCKAAIRWLRAHAAEYELDPAHFGVWGASAGGHLVALLGTTGNIKDFDVGENLDQSSAVQCVIDWFGPSDFLHWGNDNASIAKVESLVSRLLGGPVPERRELARLASPVNFVGPQSAPFLILHGDQDPLVPLQQSEVLDLALKKAGVPSELLTIQGGNHGGPGFTDPARLFAMKTFVDRYLKPAAAAGQ